MEPCSWMYLRHVSSIVVDTCAHKEQPVAQQVTFLLVPLPNFLQLVLFCLFMTLSEDFDVLAMFCRLWATAAHN